MLLFYFGKIHSKTGRPKRQKSKPRWMEDMVVGSDNDVSKNALVDPEFKMEASSRRSSIKVASIRSFANNPNSDD